MMDLVESFGPLLILAVVIIVIVLIFSPVVRQDIFQSIFPPFQVRYVGTYENEEKNLLTLTYNVQIDGFVVTGLDPTGNVTSPNAVIFLNQRGFLYKSADSDLDYHLLLDGKRGKEISLITGYEEIRFTFISEKTEWQAEQQAAPPEAPEPAGGDSQENTIASGTTGSAEEVVAETNENYAVDLPWPTMVVYLRPGAGIDDEGSSIPYIRYGTGLVEQYLQENPTYYSKEYGFENKTALIEVYDTDDNLIVEFRAVHMIRNRETYIEENLSRYDLVEELWLNGPDGQLPSIQFYDMSNTLVMIYNVHTSTIYQYEELIEVVDYF